MKEILLPPHYPNLARWWVRALADHSFDKGNTQPIVSFMEIIRYLALTDKPSLDRIIAAEQRKNG